MQSESTWCFQGVTQYCVQPHILLSIKLAVRLFFSQILDSGTVIDSGTTINFGRFQKSGTINKAKKKNTLFLVTGLKKIG